MIPNNVRALFVSMVTVPLLVVPLSAYLTERKHFPDLVLDGKAGKYKPVGGKCDCFSKAKVVFWILKIMKNNFRMRTGTADVLIYSICVALLLYLYCSSVTQIHSLKIIQCDFQNCFFKAVYHSGNASTP